jgi:hypothetical protein
MTWRYMSCLFAWNMALEKRTLTTSIKLELEPEYKDYPGSTLSSIVYHIDVLMSKSNLI